MNAKSEKLDLIPEDFGSIAAAAEFWDTHDLSDYWDKTTEVQFDVDLEREVILVPVEQNIARRMADIAKKQGLSTETLVNVWLSERLQHVAASAL